MQVETIKVLTYECHVDMVYDYWCSFMKSDMKLHQADYVAKTATHNVLV